MIVYLLVATVALPNVGVTRVIPADRPFFATLQECQRSIPPADEVPPMVVTLACERRTITKEGFAK